MKKFWKIFLLLYIVSFLARIFYFFNHLPFAQDQIRDFLYIGDLIESGQLFIPFGPSTSVGNFFLPPLYYYFQMFAQIIFFNEYYSMDILVIFVESLTPLLIFFLTYKMTKKPIVAIFSSLIYIFSPGVLIASYAWNPNLIPFFSTLFIVSFLVYFIDKKKLYSGLALISFVVLINLHFQWFVLLPLLIILILFNIIQISKTWKTLAFSILFSCFLVLPYLIIESNSGFVNTISAISFLNKKETVFERVKLPVYGTVFYSNFYHRVLFNNNFISNWEHQYEKIEPQILIGSIIFWIVFLTFFKFAVDDFNKNKNYYPISYISIFVIMAIILRFYKGDKPDYYLYVFLQFFPIFICYSISMLTNKHMLRVIIFCSLIFLEIVAVLKIPTFNAYESFEEIATGIVKLESSVYIETLNPELDFPVKYFSNKKDLNIVSKDNSKFNILLCYTREICQNSNEFYQENENNKVITNNLYTAVITKAN